MATAGVVWGLVLTLVLFDPFIAQSKPPAKPAARSTAAAAGARMSDALVAAIQALTTDRSDTEFLPLSDYADGSMRLSVNSNRNLIAWQTAKAASSGGRFRPSAAARFDWVTVDCGDSDLGDIFECSRVRVFTPNKQLVKPLSYTAGGNSYRNALGAKWRVREVLAIYDARQLRGGFTVAYADFGGTEWTFTVSAKDADEDLLLNAAAAIDQPPNTAIHSKGCWRTSSVQPPS